MHSESIPVVAFSAHTPLVPRYASLQLIRFGVDRNSIIVLSLLGIASNKCLALIYFIYSLRSVIYLDITPLLSRQRNVLIQLNSPRIV